MVDQNRVEGFARDVGGKVQDAVGGLMGNSSTQARGKSQSSRGNGTEPIGPSCGPGQRLRHGSANRRTARRYRSGGDARPSAMSALALGADMTAGALDRSCLLDGDHYVRKYL